MLKPTPWPKLLPLLGGVLALVLVVTAGLLWRGRAGDGGDLARLMVEIQEARLQARAALAGAADGFDGLEGSRREVGRLRRLVSSRGDADARRFVASADWGAADARLDEILGGRAAVLDVQSAQRRLSELTTELAAATRDLAGSLADGDVEANGPQLERFEATVEGMRPILTMLAAAQPPGDFARRLSDAGEYIGRVVRGLRGGDAALGTTPVTGEASLAHLAAVTDLSEEARDAIGAVAGAGDRWAAAATASAELEEAAERLHDAYDALNSGARGPGVLDDGRAPIVLLGLATFIVLLMMFAYYRARDFRRAAEIQAEQNERNQQAILRLLDELSSLADGDLTVQATVTEDITGAIADSINYAIEALRELVATISESSILVDAATKQTEVSARHLLRSSETQAQQVAAASDSMGRMAASIGEVSGNAERCSDVARHAVDVAHKGGEAVRRTIEGMNTIRETIQDTAKRIKRLGESSQEIGNIVELIEEIAEQTNILALNASIEASRAGEASRGFAVVADEVQKLAERSTNATKKIEVLVSTIQSDTNGAVVSMERSTTDVVGGALLAENAGAALDEIEQVSHQIASLVQNISESSKGQANVAGAITKNMQVLREISSKTAESTAGTSGAISKLSELATQLRKTVAGFRLPDHGGTGVLGTKQVAGGAQDGEGERQPREPVTEVVEHRRQQSG